MALSALDDYRFTRASGILGQLASSGRIIPEEIADPAQLADVCGEAALVLEHPALPLVSYPYEWSFSQLQAAALHHLDLQIDLLDAGITLSDASAYNLQFLGARPVFIDALSFRRYLPGEPWQGYRQFCEQFLNPLLLRTLLGVPHNAWLRGSPEGIPVIALAGMLRLRHYRHWQVLAHVVLHARFQRAALGGAHGTTDASPRATRLAPQAFRQTLRGLRDFIAGLAPGGNTLSVWEDYSAHNSYSASEEAAKRAAVSRFCAEERPARLCDIGCNTGDYSVLALQSGARHAVALDADDACIDALFRRAAALDLPLLSLCCDIGNPSPALGWAQQERAGLLERLESDALFALGLVHHLAIGRNLPLPHIVDLLLRIAPRGLVEFVPKSDPMCVQLLAHRTDIFPDYHEEAFAAALGARAAIIESTPVTATGRRIYRYRALQA